MGATTFDIMIESTSVMESFTQDRIEIGQEEVKRVRFENYKEEEGEWENDDVPQINLFIDEI